MTKAPPPPPPRARRVARALAWLAGSLLSLALLAAPEARVLADVVTLKNGSVLKGSGGALQC